MARTDILPSMGLGTFRLQGQDAFDAVTSALALGYRLIDTAQMYGNEEAVGKAIRHSDVPREDIFVTTKVWWDRLTHDDLIVSLEESCHKLGDEQIDLALIHWPSPNEEVPMSEYIGALGEARERGLAARIGVSNFTIPQLNEALAMPGGDQIVTNQVEVHPFLANRKLVDHCQGKRLQVTGYMPLAVGKVMNEPVLDQIAAAHDATPAQIALAWLLARNITVIPSSAKPEHQQANLKALEIELTANEMARIDGLDSGERIANPDFAPGWDR